MVQSYKCDFLCLQAILLNIQVIKDFLIPSFLKVIQLFDVIIQLELLKQISLEFFESNLTIIKLFIINLFYIKFLLL